MNIDLLKIRSAELKQLLEDNLNYSASVERCYHLLVPIFEGIENGTIHLPLKSVPFSYEFSDGQLRDIPELDQAFGEFAFEVQGMKLSFLEKILLR